MSTSTIQNNELDTKSQPRCSNFTNRICESRLHFQILAQASNFFFTVYSGVTMSNEHIISDLRVVHILCRQMWHICEISLAIDFLLRFHPQASSSRGCILSMAPLFSQASLEHESQFNTFCLIAMFFAFWESQNRCFFLDDLVSSNTLISMYFIITIRPLRHSIFINHQAPFPEPCVGIPIFP